MTRVLLALAVLLVAAGALAWMTAMPGASFVGPLPPLSAVERDSAARIERDVAVLAADIGERNHRRHAALIRAADHLEARLAAIGLASRRRPVEVDGRPFYSIEAVASAGDGSDRPIVVVGAHYDSVVGSPGADDNASGVAVALELARLLAGTATGRAVHVVLFVNEEPPHFRTATMGSLAYADALAGEGTRVAAMLSLESLGYYASEPGSQRYPWPFALLYPDRGDFVAFVGNLGSRALVRAALAEFRRAARFPSEGIAAPSLLPGVSWSDQWSFWRHGVPGIMVTDTVPFRNPHYHRATDTPATVDPAAMARVAHGLAGVLRSLAR